MKILVLNAGSSSLKYQLLDAANNLELCAKGICERVGSVDASIKHGIDENETVISQPMHDHNEALDVVLHTLLEGEDPALTSLDEIGAVGHRIVQGGHYFPRSVRITPRVIEKIDELCELAPLHNKAALMGIEACTALMPNVFQAAVFDTSFFTTLTPRAYMYPIPYEYFEKYHIRKYGAHGTSHRYIAERAAQFLGEPLDELKLITCHLGNGCSMAAIDNGIAVDTTMGLTPLDGLMMGTRSGALDPAIVTFLMEHEGLSPQEMNDILNKKSGLLGISGVSNDLRSVRKASEEGCERAQLAYEMYSNSVKKFIGAYIATMGGVDAIVLTAGVGENCDKMRRMIFAGLQPLGIVLDEKLNHSRGFEREISTEDSKVKIIIIPTNEEKMIAQDTLELFLRKAPQSY